MCRPKPKSKNQRRNDWLRRRQNIARGMRIAMYEINQALAEKGLRIDFPPDFIPYTIAVAEGGRISADRDDVAVAHIWNVHRAIQANGFVAVRL